MKFLSSKSGKDLLRRIHSASDSSLRAEFESLLLRVVQSSANIKSLRKSVNSQRFELGMSEVEYASGLAMKLTHAREGSRSRDDSMDSGKGRGSGKGLWKRAMKAAKNKAKANKVNTADTTAEFQARKVRRRGEGREAKRSRA